MPQSLARVWIHIVFSTKSRWPWLKEPDVRRELWAYTAAAMKRNDSPARIVNGVADHVHALCLLSRKCAIKDLLEDVKVSTSKWVKKKGAAYRQFRWQNGYGAFSVSESKVRDVEEYIARQETHHRRRTFQDEFRRMCKLHGLELDERYAWD